MYRLIKLLTLFLFLNSCGAAFVSPKTKLTLLSATVQADGSVLLEGNIDSESDDGFQELGFCFSEDSLPSPLNSTTEARSATRTGKKFSVTYESRFFRYEGVYHFRGFARYNSEHTYTNDVSLSKITPAPVTPSCTWAANTCNIGGGQPTATMNTATISSNMITATGSGPQLVMEVYQLKAGAYKTASSGGLTTVKVYFYSGFIQETLKDGSDVYINVISPGLYEVTICNGAWTLNGGSTRLYLNARFMVRR